MSVPADRYAPPQPPGRAQSIGLAVLVHLVLIAALTWGVNWRHEATVTAEAELWSATPQQAAPRPVEPPPAPPPPPPVQAAPTPPPPAPRPAEADIALQQEKERLAAEKRRQQEAEEKRRLAEAERRREQEAERQRKLAADKLEREREERQQAEARKKEQLAEQQRRREEDRKREVAQRDAREREQQDASRMEKLREENLRRIQGMAGATGSAAATGTAMQSSGPTQSYAGRIRARVKPNIVFTDDVPGNPSAEVEVRMAPDGTITARRITKASGIKSWDEAVLRALDRTETLPRDLDGRVHSPLIIEFRPKG